MSNYPCSLTRNMTSHIIKNLAFHSLLRWKMIILPILTTSLIHFSLKSWKNILFDMWGLAWWRMTATILVKSIWYTLKICYVFIIAPCSMMKAALFPKLGPPPYNVASRGTLWVHWPNIVWGGGGGEEWWNCQKRPSLPWLLTRIVVILLNVLPCNTLGLDILSCMQYFGRLLQQAVTAC